MSTNERVARLPRRSGIGSWLSSLLPPPERSRPSLLPPPSSQPGETLEEIPMWLWSFHRNKRRLEAERQEAEHQREMARKRCARVQSVDPAVRRMVTDLIVHREFLPKSHPKE